MPIFAEFAEFLLDFAEILPIGRRVPDHGHGLRDVPAAEPGAARPARRDGARGPALSLERPAVQLSAET